MTSSRDLVFALRSDCTRVQHLAAWGTSGREVAVDLGLPEAADVSPFAALAGGQFERVLLADQAAELSRLYQAVIGVGVNSVIEVSDEVGDNPLKATSDLLTSTSAAGTVVYQGQVAVVVAGHEHVVKPDLLFWDGSRWRVGEIKAYLVEGGFEDRHRFSDAVAQAALGASGVARLGAPVAEVVDVFRHDRVQNPIHTDAPIAIWSEHLNRFADQATVDREFRDEATSVEALTAIEHVYDHRCETRCGLAAMCRP